MRYLENKLQGKERFLLVFSMYGCMRERLPGLSEGSYRLCLPSNVTGKGEITVTFIVRKGGWYFEEKALNTNAPCYAELSDDIELLMMLSDEIKWLRPCRKLMLKQSEVLKAGGAYQNQIFYECFSLILSKHIEIYCRDNVWMVQNHGLDGVYLNEQFLKEKGRLRSGDRIDLYGLHLVVLGEMLAVYDFCGICRTAYQEKLPENAKFQREGNIGLPYVIEKKSRSEEVMYCGELEVLPPPPSERQNRSPVLLALGPNMTMILPVLLMAAAGSYMQQGTGSNFYFLSLIMSVCSSFLALFWGLTNHFYAKYHSRKNERNRVAQYREYLGRTRQYLLECREENRGILIRKYPPVPFFIQKNGVSVLWNSYYLQKEFLFTRMGLGSVPFQIQLKKSSENSIVPDRLWEETKQLMDEFENLEGVPVGVDLENSRVLGLSGEGAGLYGVLRQILFQIAANHSYAEVKVACFYHKKSHRQQQLVSCIRWMPHSWSDNGRIRYLAGDEKEAAQILPDLTKAIEKGRENLEKGIKVPWYLLVILEEEELIGEPVYQYLTEPESQYPVSGIFIKESKEELPVCCNCILTQTAQTGELVRYQDAQISRETIQLETCGGRQLLTYLRQISGCKVSNMPGNEQLPEQVSFLELYRCRKVEELDSAGRWEKNHSGERLKIPIGLRSGDSCVYLDIHEKFHGPHGLIAGTTGSGKSELIQTCLLSMAVSFSPRDVNFFMIDYKGGGTGKLLETLPHCAGVISNLSGKQIKRAMSAISSENKRRQALLSKYGVNHVDAYMELYYQGKIGDPMPHLILVVDEFAELKKEEPEFMQEIISLAQVGRSLGIHLILATQKPAGIVDDKIWSNARFRLCLRVQDGQDSMDMLHKKDAAMLTAPGQCYLQIGNHEYYELFQTAYCGGAYLEEGEEKEAAAIVTDTGKRIYQKRKEPQQKTRSQLETVVSYVNQTAKMNHYEKTRTLWLEELPEVLALEERHEKDKYLIGLCDDPGSQSQYPVFYEPGRQGHLAVCGGPATGKTTLLQTLLWQMVKRTSERARVLIISLGGGMLESFENFPHCLGFMRQESERNIFFFHFKKLVQERKKELSGLGFSQHNMSSHKKLPEIYLIMDNYGSIAAGFTEEQEEFIFRLLGEGPSLGIYMILTAAGSREIPGRMFEKIKRTIAFELSDAFLYGDILRQYHISVYPKENVQGRGLCKEEGRILEFQTAIVFGEKEDYRRMKKIEEAGNVCMHQYLEEKKEMPQRFPEIPEKPDSMNLYHTYQKTGSLDVLPLGYDMETGEIQGISLQTCCFLISGAAGTGRRNLLCHMAQGLLNMGRSVVLLECGGRLAGFRERHNVYSPSDWQENAAWTDGLVKEKQTCLLIENLAVFTEWLYGAAQRTQRDFFEKEAAGKGKLLMIVAVYQSEGDYGTQGTEFFRQFVKGQHGIHLGGNLAGQRALNFEDISYSMQNIREKPGIGYLKTECGKETRRVRLPLFAKKQNADEL